VRAGATTTGEGGRDASPFDESSFERDSSFTELRMFSSNVLNSNNNSSLNKELEEALGKNRELVTLVKDREKRIKELEKKIGDEIKSRLVGQENLERSKERMLRLETDLSDERSKNLNLVLIGKKLREDLRSLSNGKYEEEPSWSLLDKIDPYGRVSKGKIEEMRKTMLELKLAQRFMRAAVASELSSSRLRTEMENVAKAELARINENKRNQPTARFFA
jgi:hypothetical protein